jgi:hypothetical protein
MPETLPGVDGLLCRLVEMRERPACIHRGKLLVCRFVVELLHPLHDVADRHLVSRSQRQNDLNIAGSILLKLNPLTAFLLRNRCILFGADSSGFGACCCLLCLTLAPFFGLNRCLTLTLDALLFGLGSVDFVLLTLNLGTLCSHPRFVLGLLLAHRFSSTLLRYTLLSGDALTFGSVFGLLLSTGGCCLALLFCQFGTLTLKRFTFRSDSSLFRLMGLLGD